MINAARLLVAVSALWGAFSGFTQSFTGTNAPGAGTDFTFTPAAGVTNFSVVVSNNATAFSYVLLKKGGIATDTVFDFIARLSGQTNEINLELPEYVAATYGLRILTPTNSDLQAFTAVVTTNRNDLRSSDYPVLKPLVFSTTGILNNSGSGAWQYFQVDVPSNLLTGWRLTVSSTSATTPLLYVLRGSLPTTSVFDKVSSSPTVETLIFNSAEATNSTYFIGVYLPAGPANLANYILSAELASTTALTWDPGATDAGTVGFTNQSASGGDYYFAITTQTTADAVWRTALNVLGGEADLYLAQGAPPTTNSYNYASSRAGSDGFVLSQSAGQFAPGQNWFLLVRASPGAQWNLVSGEAYVQPLPALAADGSSSGLNVKMGAEGMHFFKTTISSNTLAWQLGLNGLANQLYVLQTAAPHPAAYDLTQAGQMLLVPAYLNTGSQYFVGVTGDPGLTFSLNSRQQPVTTIAFGATNSIALLATNYGYTSFLVQVPVQQIAWQVNALPTVGSPSVAVRRDNVPNEFVNDAFSDTAGGVGNSITLVPPVLSDGTFYVTVYGTGAYTCALINGQPVITLTNYIFAITNDAPNRVGWRYYTVVNTSNQLGSLGWDLELANAPTGTEIAIRRNAVPSAWNYRSDFRDDYSYGSLSYVDLSSTLGFLQQPNHPADVWYIGVYSPATALGSFVLTGSQLTAAPVGFDGAGSTANVANQPAGKYQYYRLTVPGDALGWDVRLTSVTSGSPTFSICRDLLPPGNGQNWYPFANSTWPSGNQWFAGVDWTGDYYNADSTIAGQVLAMGMGNPLVPGTYYIGIINSGGTTPMSYTLMSRGIGSGYTIPVNPLAFTNGVVNNPGLLGREAAYYSLVVPTNTPSWRVELNTNIGESLLLIQKDALPNVDAGAFGLYASFDLLGGRKMQKAGNEQYLMMPLAGQTNIIAGTYYLAVASQGVNPSSSALGTGSSSFTLRSFGSINVTNIGIVDKTGNTDLLVTNGGLEEGQFSTYQFAVPTNTFALEVFLENKTGNPVMTLRADNQFPGGYPTYNPYGYDGGQGYPWYDANLINIANPAATNYTLMVQALAADPTQGVGGGDASFDVRIRAIGPQSVNFDLAGNTWPISNQAPGLWQYFVIHVPADPNLLGWDLRLTNVTGTANGTVPGLYVCRDTAPSDSNPNSWGNAYASSSWPSGSQWLAGVDWTSDYYNADATVAAPVLAVGIGNPLQPGTYYAGIFNNRGTTPISYTLVSRGIGSGYAIPVNPLAFTNGVVSNPGLLGREAAYYSLVVPTNMPSWRVELNTNIGDSLLMIQKDALPSVAAGTYGASFDLGGGRKMYKAGNQQYLLMPVAGQTNIVAGTYYLAVASEGESPKPSTLGTGSSSFTLSSFGSLNVINIGTVGLTNFTVTVTNSGLEEGQFCAYQFTVPPATFSLELFLENKTGGPVMMLRPDNQLTGGYPLTDPSGNYDNYGNDGGQGYSWYDANLINIASPAATNYTLMVQAAAWSGEASYDVRIHVIGPQPVMFDGEGSAAAIANQAPNLWQYFVIEVPADTNLLGWDLRLTNMIAPAGTVPSMYVCRDAPPSLNNPNSWSPSISAAWPSGYQWSAGGDWTGDYYNADGTVFSPMLAMGMGNPLQPGIYYVGVLNNGGATPISYTLVSRGIGNGFAIPVNPLAFTNGVVSNPSLVPREAAYYRLVVPTNVPDWKMRLTDVSGETLLMLQKDVLPNVGAGYNGGRSFDLYGGRKMQKAGNEEYLLLPLAGESYVFGGTYYLAVVSEGVNPSNPYIGTNTSSYTLTSFGLQGITNLGTVGGTDVLQTNAIRGGENAFYQFSIPAGPSAVELRLDNIAGNPIMTLATGTNIPAPADSYGSDGGVGYSWSSATLITLPNPTVTTYTLTVAAVPAGDAEFTVHLRQMPTPSIAFDPSLNSGPLSNTAAGTLSDGQSTFYKVTVPAMLNGQPVIGWTLNVSQTSGSARVRVCPGVVPDDYSINATSPFFAGEWIFVAPYLTPGVWYVEVRGAGSTSYMLSSSNLQLKRPAWFMPVTGGTVTTPGLTNSAPLFADTGVSTDGTNSPGDQGIDLAQGAFDYYEILVPTNNTGLLRTRLDAISGNPKIYVRAGAPPNLSLFDRSLNASSGSEYGNWVPSDGRHEAYLIPGPWYLAVQAAGNSNVRYRLRLDTGNISSLSLDHGSFTNQLLAAGDWLYYSVVIPTNAPVNWNVVFSTQLGSVSMYVRDRVPPGQATTVTDLRDWSSDSKNHGPYPSFTTPGAYTLTTPPLRPGNTYYLGFYAVSDCAFSVTNSTNNGNIDYASTLAFYGGYTTGQLPAFGQLKFRIDVPGNASEWIHTATYPASVSLFLDQGSAPTLTGSDDWSSINNANLGLDVSLANADGWPWLPGYSYFLNVTNTSGSAQPFSLLMSGVYPGGVVATISRAGRSLANGHFQFDVTGPNSTYCLIEVSTNAFDFKPLFTNAPFTGTFHFDDPQARNSFRLYKVLIQP